MRGPLEPFLHQLVVVCARNEIRRCGDDRGPSARSRRSSASRVRASRIAPHDVRITTEHPTIGSKPDDPGVRVERDLAKRALDTAQRAAPLRRRPLRPRDEENALVRTGASMPSIAATRSVWRARDRGWCLGLRRVADRDSAGSDRVAALAVESPRPPRITKKRTRTRRRRPDTRDLRTPLDLDPFRMSFDDRVKLLLNAEAAYARAEGPAHDTRGVCGLGARTALVSSEGPTSRSGSPRSVRHAAERWATGAAGPHVPRRPPHTRERRRVGDLDPLGSHGERRARRREASRCSPRSRARRTRSRP